MRNVKRNIKIKRNKEGKRYYKPVKYPDIPPTSNDLYIITTVGDRLDLLANQFYNDVNLWWIISSASLGEGLEIRIPATSSAIIRLFESINK